MKSLVLLLLSVVAYAQTTTPLIGAIKALKGNVLYNTGDGELCKDVPLSDFSGQCYGETFSRHLALSTFTVNSVEYDGGDLILLHLTDHQGMKWAAKIENLRLIGPSANGTQMALALSGWLQELPKSLTPKEIEAVKFGQLFVGMSELAAKLELGQPQRKRVSEQSEVWSFEKRNTVLTFDASTKKLISYSRDEP